MALSHLKLKSLKSKIEAKPELKTEVSPKVSPKVVKINKKKNVTK